MAIHKIVRIDGDRVFLLHKESREQFGFYRSKGGARQYAMLKKWYYFSANPLHIRQAKLKIAASIRRQNKKKAKKDALLALSTPIGKLLGDGTRYDSYGARATKYQRSCQPD